MAAIRRRDEWLDFRPATLLFFKMEPYITPSLPGSPLRERRAFVYPPSPRAGLGLDPA